MTHRVLNLLFPLSDLVDETQTITKIVGFHGSTMSLYAKSLT